MMILEKRTYDRRTYDIDCTDLLAPDETIQSVTSITSDHASLVMDAGYINVEPITYPNGYVAGIRKVVQTQIHGGTIGVKDTYVDCIIRVRVVTNLSPQLEATVTLRLKDTP